MVAGKMMREKGAVHGSESWRCQKDGEVSDGLCLSLAFAYAVSDGIGGWRKTQPPRRDGA